MTTASQEIMLEVGDAVPWFELRTGGGKSIGLSGLLGKHLLFLFLPRVDTDDARRELNEFAQRIDQFGQQNVVVVAISPEAAASVSDDAKVVILHDSARQVFGAYGVSIDPPVRTTFLIDPSLRIVRKYCDPDPTRHAQQILDDLQQQIARDPVRNVVTHAPVLLIPNALPLEVCRRLIEIWETQGNEDSGSMIMRDGKTVPVYNYDHKIRRDHFMKPGPDEEWVKKYLARRVLPEIRKAFNSNVTRREDFRIACYDASRGGYFRPHRDNTTDGTAHRRFAMSLLLNDDYEGGYLRFPEFGPHLYRPDAGGAVIFSCSLLHEATDVTAGRRFVLLSFFYGEQEARIREEYNKRTGGNYRA